MNKVVVLGAVGFFSGLTYLYIKNFKKNIIPEPVYTIAKSILLDEKKILEFGVNKTNEYFRIIDQDNNIITSSHKVLNLEVGINRLDYFLEDNYTLTFIGNESDTIILIIRHNNNIANLYTINKKNKFNNFTLISFNSEKLDKLKQLF
jgi:hypothetical protein